MADDREAVDRCHALVLSGGMALGAFHAGAYAALQEAGGPEPDWLAGASIGAVTGAIIAGNPPGGRTAQLRRFWDAVASDLGLLARGWPAGPGLDSAWRRPEGWTHALAARLFGRPGLFRSRAALGLVGETPGLYDLAPMRELLQDVVDFDLLNGPMAPRLSVATTDLVTGERVVFDTRRDAQIGPEHLTASCALIPDFAPVAIGGRLLGDGAFSGNMPVDLVLDKNPQQDLVCFALDLFGRKSSPPRALPDAAARAMDLLLGCQSALMLESLRREDRMRGMIRRLADGLPPELRDQPEIAPVLSEGYGPRVILLHLAYRAPAGEADMQKTFDFSPAALTARREAGAEHMRAALQVLPAVLAGGPDHAVTMHAVHPDRGVSTVL
jgi:NTE family protein